jgi:hypothetical protein
MRIWECGKVFSSVAAFSISVQSVYTATDSAGKYFSTMPSEFVRNLMSRSVLSNPDSPGQFLGFLKSRFLQLFLNLCLTSSRVCKKPAKGKKGVAPDSS